MSVRNAFRKVVDPEVVVFLVLGAGITASYFDLGFAGLIFALGFIVLLPLSDVLSRKLGTDEEPDAEDERDRGVGSDDASDEVDESAALETLRERYARGEIDELEYERRLEALLETESVGEAREYLRDGAGSRPTADSESVRTDAHTDDARKTERDRS